MEKEQVLKLAEKAQENIFKIKNFLDENKHIFCENFNLKLHEISYISDDEDFSTFCDIEYQNFNNWAEGEKINLSTLMEYIGRTSTFNFVDDHGIIQADSWYGYDYQATIEELYEYCMGYIHFFNINYGIDKNLKLDIDYILAEAINEENEEIIEFLEFFGDDEALNTLKYFCEDTFKVYEYINGFKENQVEIFNDFMEVNGGIFLCK